MQPAVISSQTNPPYRNLYKTSAMAGLGMLGIMLAQVAVFIIWPPPESVEGFFGLFQQNWLLGLLSLDLLYLLNNSILILIYLALFAALKPKFASASLIALVLGLVGIAAYFASNPAFEMLSLSRQFAAAGTESQRVIALAAGGAMLATYKGTAFDMYYVLNAACLLIFAAAMLRSGIFSRGTALWGLAAGVLMLIPSTAGTLGLIFSLASLIPWAVFLILICLRFFRFSAHATPI
jgi:hypothetical protein